MEVPSTKNVRVMKPNYLNMCSLLLNSIALKMF